MASHVQIVLREDVNHLGRSGELVRVRAGYARNFLIPRGLATIATRSNIAEIEHERARALARAEKVRSALEDEAKKLQGVRAQVAKEAGPEGKLYGSVTAQDVADALSMRDVEIDKRKIVMPDEPIKVTGDYELTAKFGHGVEVAFALTVVTKS